MKLKLQKPSNKLFVEIMKFLYQKGCIVEVVKETALEYEIKVRVSKLNNLLK